MSTHDILFAVQIVGTIAVLVCLALSLLNLRDERGRSRRLEKQLDQALLEQTRMTQAARDAFPYLAQTSVDLFYGEINGQQANFAQRQEIAAKVQKQNAAVLAYKKTFNITPSQEIRLSVSPDISGRDSIDMLNKFDPRTH